MEEVSQSATSPVSEGMECVCDELGFSIGVLLLWAFIGGVLNIVVSDVDKLTLEKLVMFFVKFCINLKYGYGMGDNISPPLV